MLFYMYFFPFGETPTIITVHDIVYIIWMYSQIYEWCNYMKMSGRLPKVKSENNGSRKVGTLCTENLALLERSYSLIIKEYTDLTNQL